MFQLKSIKVWAGTALFVTAAVPARAADVTLAWDANTAPVIAGYMLYWGTEPGVYSGNADVGTKTSYVVTGLESDKRYYFTVRSYSSGGTMSPASKEVSGMPPAIAAPKPAPNPSPNPSVQPNHQYRINSGDFDGDGRADVTIYRPEDGVWYILKSSANFGAGMAYQWGTSTDIPVAGDYDGDGRSDIAVWRPETGVWWVLTSSSRFHEIFDAGMGCGFSRRCARGWRLRWRPKGRHGGVPARHRGVVDSDLELKAMAHDSMGPGFTQ